MKKINKAFPELKVFEQDVRNLETYEKNSVSTYLSFGVVEHFPEGPQDILKEASRVVKKNGILFLTVPYMNKVRVLKYLFGHRKVGKDQFYQYMYSKSEMMKYIQDAGFKVIRTKPRVFLGGVRKDFPFVNKLWNRKKKGSINLDKKVVKKVNPKMSFKRRLMIYIESILCHFDSHSMLIVAMKK